MPPGLLASIDLSDARQVRKGSRSGQEDRSSSIRTFPSGITSFPSTLGYLERLDEAENALRRASERKLDIPEFPVQRYDIAFLKGDKAGMEREVAQAQGKAGAEDWCPPARLSSWHIPATCSRQERCHGVRRTLAQQAARRGRAALVARPAQRCGRRFSGTRLRPGRARWQRWSFQRTGMWNMAPRLRWRSRRILPVSNTRERSGNALPGGHGSPIQLPASRFARVLALNRGEPSKAIELLKTAAPYELGVPLCSAPQRSSGSSIRSMCAAWPIWPLHQGAEAAAEFQKILDHRGIVISDPIGALAHLQLGQSVRPVGRYDQGEACLPGFPDPLERRRPRHPDPQAGRAEYAKLQ